jgi:hypothetical protein
MAALEAIEIRYEERPALDIRRHSTSSRGDPPVGQRLSPLRRVQYRRVRKGDIERAFEEAADVIT